jgi:hypothetical protein
MLQSLRRGPAGLPIANDEAAATAAAHTDHSTRRNLRKRITELTRNEIARESWVLEWVCGWTC